VEQCYSECFFEDHFFPKPKGNGLPERSYVVELPHLVTEHLQVLRVDLGYPRDVRHPIHDPLRDWVAVALVLAPLDKRKKRETTEIPTVVAPGEPRSIVSMVTRTWTVDTMHPNNRNEEDPSQRSPFPIPLTALVDVRPSLISSP